MIRYIGGLVPYSLLRLLLVISENSRSTYDSMMEMMFLIS